VGARSGFSVNMSNVLSDIQAMDNGQSFPRYLYEIAPPSEESQGDYLANAKNLNDTERRDAITEEGLSHFQAAYPSEKVSKDDLFYYVYGLLHSPEYCSRFADNLSKQLPRIPAVKKAADFWGFVAAGRTLGDLHCDYESAELFPVNIAQGALDLAHICDPVSFYRVEKMKFHKKRNAGGELRQDRSTIIYNANITITDIPLEAYDYIVNGKAALEWVVERQCVKTDKKSGLVSDANAYANGVNEDPAYPLKLLQRVITVSLETMRIVRGLPKLDID